MNVFLVIVYGDMSHIQCDTDLDADAAIFGYDYKRFHVHGEYMHATDLIGVCSFKDGVLSVPGRFVEEK